MHNYTSCTKIEKVGRSPKCYRAIPWRILSSAKL